MKTSNLASRLIEARTARGLSQTDLAKKAGTSQQSVQQIESGFVRSPRNIPDLAKVLKVEVSWLQFGGELKENKFLLHHEEEEILQKYRTLSMSDKKLFRQLLSRFKGENDSKKT